MYKSNKLIAQCSPEPQASAAHKRRSLVHILSRSPKSDISWEEDPRATGWYGMKVRNTGPTNPAAIYHITVESD